MPIDYSGFKFPKDRLRVEQREDKRKREDRLERQCRALVHKRDRFRCQVPGCKDRGEQHHIALRSTAPALKFDPNNRVTLCRLHHALVHAGRLHLERGKDGLRVW